MISIILIILIKFSSFYSQSIVHFPIGRPVSLSLASGSSFKQYQVAFGDLIITAPYVLPWKAFSKHCVCFGSSCKLPVDCVKPFQYKLHGSRRVAKIGYQYWGFRDYFVYVKYRVTGVRFDDLVVPVHSDYIVLARSSECCYVFLKRLFEGPLVLYSNDTHVYFEDVPSKVLQVYFFKTYFIPLDFSNTEIKYKFVCDTKAYSRSYHSNGITYYQNVTDCYVDVLPDGFTRTCTVVKRLWSVCPDYSNSTITSSELLSQSPSFIYVKRMF